MKRNILILITLVAAFYSCSNATTKQVKETNIPDATVNNAPAPAAISLPALKMVDLKGKPFNLADFKGKKIFVNLWAAWCPPCRAEIPSIERLYSNVDRTKVAFIMLSLDEAFTTAVNFASNNKLTTPVFYPAENLPALFNVQGIPATFIFDENGNLVKQVEGGDDYDTEAYIKLFSN